jgi:hypothetical protein
MKLAQRSIAPILGDRSPAPGPLSTLLVLGAQKCGTNTRAAALRGHPDVSLPELKEASPLSRRARVQEFRVENELLARWLHRDLPAWNRSTS